MSKGKKTELQVTVQSQDQWEELLLKDGLIVVDAYAAWCGPCKAIVSTLKRIKNELGDDYLHFATAETDNIDSLSLYRGKSQPTFLFYSSGVLVYVIRGCNCPVMIRAITSQLEKEHKIMEGKAERNEYFDEVVGARAKVKKDEEKECSKDDEELAAKMSESMLRLKNNISFRDMQKVETEVSKEVSLAIIKPDAVKAGLVEEIIAKVKSEGMEILRQEERTLTKEEAAEFYKQHEGSEHFDDLVEFMSSGPCMTLIISKAGTAEGIIPEFRDLIGPKDVNKAKEEAPNSIRAVYGTSSVMNAIHACDTSESAARELAFFFPDFVSPTVKTKKATRPSSRTLALIRPDALRHHKDSILDKVKEAGFSIAMAKEVTLTQEEAEDFYSEHRGKDFFEALVKNMCSGPVMALCLARDDAVEGWRNLLGPKEIDIAKKEAPDSLRAQFHVEESDMNPLHGSESHSAAHREIEKIFPVETTVAVIKPETSQENGDQIISSIEEAGFRIISRKDVGLTRELAGQFYHEHEGKDFFTGLTDYMSSGQSTVLLLEREDAVTGWRALMGPTDPAEARKIAPDSIRARFGKDICKNAVHGSSNKDNAEQVITQLFPEVELLPNGRVTSRSKSEALDEESESSLKQAGFANDNETQDIGDTNASDVTLNNALDQVNDGNLEAAQHCDKAERGEQQSDGSPEKKSDNVGDEAVHIDSTSCSADVGPTLDRSGDSDPADGIPASDSTSKQDEVRSASDRSADGGAVDGRLTSDSPSKQECIMTDTPTGDAGTVHGQLDGTCSQRADDGGSSNHDVAMGCEVKKEDTIETSFHDDANTKPDDSVFTTNSADGPINENSSPKEINDESTSRSGTSVKSESNGSQTLVDSTPDKDGRNTDTTKE